MSSRTPRDSDLIGMEYGLRIKNFKRSPGDSYMQPSLKTTDHSVLPPLVINGQPSTSHGQWMKKHIAPHLPLTAPSSYLHMCRHIPKELLI